MRKLTLITILILLFTNTFAQDSLSTIGELQKLLKDRRERFQSYATSADQRSGIFGNKTKKDLEESREILLDIVKTDDHILTKLNEAISTRGMAKSDYSVDVMNYTQTIDRLAAAADTLNKQLIDVRESNSSLQQKAGMQQWMIYALSAAVVILLLVVLFRKK